VKFLADLGVSITTVRVLREDGHEVIHLREKRLGRLSDAAILEKARKERCVVLTFDLDFGDLLATTIQPLPSVIIFRLRNQTPAWVTPRLMETISSCKEELATGAVVIVEDTRYRLRQLPIKVK
jgi:predicted nuclease of predicted toxin-antitoxin system